jgi:uncharacterized protein
VPSDTTRLAATHPAIYIDIKQINRKGYQMSFHGLPCWYELASADLKASQAFYADLLGWVWQDSGMEGMTYLLAKHDSAMVAGLFSAEMGRSPGWLTYFAVDNADDSTGLAASLGAQTLMPPTDIPGTGRFALLADPQGASFGILQPLPMADGSGSAAFAPGKAGHGQWHDLVTRDSGSALAFYGKLFGWSVSRSMPMGPEATYHILNRQGQDIGGCFDSATAAPFWKPYFGVASAKTAKDQVTALGGTVTSGPDEVPGGMFTLQCEDDQGMTLALVGPA